MELRHIRYFIALAEELNFSRAAERLHIAQPNLSRQIRELENIIGAPLFNRTKRQVKLTNAGKVFLNYAYNISEQVERAYVNTKLSTTGIEGELRIGFNGMVQDITPSLKQYRNKYPNVSIVLKYMTSSEQIKALSENSIDIGTISVPISSNQIVTSPLKELKFMLALPENHPLTTKKNISLADLRKETFIITPKTAGPLFYETFKKAFNNIDYFPQVTIQAHDLQTVMTLVSEGMGVSLIPKLSSYYNGVVLRKVEEVNLSIDTFLAWNKDNDSVILQKFLEFFFELDEKLKFPFDEI